MIIDCYISNYCSSEEALKKNITEAIKLESVNAEVNIHKLGELEARKRKILGSPTVLINGKDILPGELPGISWRLFIDESGRPIPVPSVNVLRGKIKKMNQNTYPEK